MDTAILVGVDVDIAAGRALLDKLIAANLEVVSGFWLYFPEARAWRLVVSTPLYDAWGPLRTYQSIQKVLAGMPDPKLELNSVSLASPQDPLIRAVSGFSHVNAPGGRWIHNAVFGGVYVEHAYIYGYGA